MGGLWEEFKYVQGVVKSRAHALVARKKHFCTPRRVFVHAHYNLEFDDAESLSGRSDDNHTPTFSNYVQIEKMKAKNKVALAVELSILLKSQWSSLISKKP